MNSGFQCCRFFLRLPAMLFVLFAALCAHGQTELGTIRGVVMDQSGAILPHVQVTLTNQETNTPQTVLSNSEGAYEFSFLPVGTYRLEVANTGFEKFVAKDILIRAREIRRVDSKLTIGTVGSEVTVEAGTATIATEGGQISAGFDNKQFVDSPMSQQTFFPQTLMTTLPLVQSQNGNVNLRFAGQGPTQIAENMDGMPNDGANNLVQNMDDFEDLQVVPAQNSAEFSRIGEFSMASRRGSNRWHGRVTYDLANSWFNATPYFNTTKPPFKEHRGTASVSGPIVRDKLFFYAAYNLDLIPASTYYQRNVPITPFRSGNFSSISTPLKNPFGVTGATFAGNQLTGINPVSQKVQDLYIPTPTTTGSNNNYQFLHPFPTDLMKWNGVTGRVDYNLTKNDQVFARFINRITPYILAGSFKQLGTWTRTRNSSSLVGNETHIFSPKVVSSLEFGWSRDYIIDGQTTHGITPTLAPAAISAIGLQGVNPQNFNVMGFPTMSINGFQTLTQNVGGVNGNRNDFFGSSITTISSGKHVIRTGAQLRYFHDNPQLIPADTFGSFVFNGTFTGNAYADFLLGLPYSSTRSNPITNRTSTAYELGIFATDTIKITPKLTADIGLRWELFPSGRYDDGLQYNWDPVTGNVIVTPEGLTKKKAFYPPGINVVAGNPFPNANLTNLRPRVGAAYRISDKFVVRGGIGVYTEALGNLYRLQGGGPFAVSETYINSIVGQTATTPGTPQFSFPNPFAASNTNAVPPSQSVVGYPTDTKQGTITQFSLTVEKELPYRIGSRVSYVGSRSAGMNYNLEINKPAPSTTPFTAASRPYRQFVSAQQVMNDGQASYDALQFELIRRTKGVVVEAHYTLSNSMYDFGNLQNPYNHYLWNRDAYNARNRFVLSTSYDLPFGRGRAHFSNAPRWADAVIGGWQTTFVEYLQSGQYFSPSFSGSDPSGTNTSGGLPDRIGNGNLPRGQRSATRYFDATAFAVPKLGTFGNSGINILEGPGLHLSHLSVLKRWRLVDGISAVFQANASNLLNSPHWDFPRTDIFVPTTVGRVYQLKDSGSALGGRELSGPRQLAFRLRIEF